MCGVLFAVVLFALVLFGERAVRAGVARARVACVRAVRACVSRARVVWRACCSRFSRKICEEENFFKFVLQNEGV